ncbi:MAG: hypothetical protein M1473_13105 [Firmicutes bacterium]|nr:hypothetical protein [Bacillota bacterium]
MSSNLVSENSTSQGRSAQNSRVKTGPAMFRERQSYAANEQRLANLRESPREEMYRVNRDQIQRIGPPPPKINATSAADQNGVNQPRGVGPVGNLIDAWA